MGNSGTALLAPYSFLIKPFKRKNSEPYTDNGWKERKEESHNNCENGPTISVSVIQMTANELRDFWVARQIDYFYCVAHLESLDMSPANCLLFFGKYFTRF